MKEEIEVLGKIAKQLERLNNNIEKSIEMTKEASKPVEVRELTPLEEAKQWMISTLNSVIIDVTRDFSKEIANIDMHSIEYSEKLLKTLKQIRAVIKVKDMVDKFFTVEGIDEAIEMLEKKIEYERKSSAENVDKGGE